MLKLFSHLIDRQGAGETLRKYSCYELSMVSQSKKLSARKMKGEGICELCLKDTNNSQHMLVASPACVLRTPY